MKRRAWDELTPAEQAEYTADDCTCDHEVEGSGYFAEYFIRPSRNCVMHGRPQTEPEDMPGAER